MFGFLKNKKTTPLPEQVQQRYPLVSKMDDATLLTLIRKVFQDGNSDVAALFLVALRNLPVYYQLFHKTALESKQYPVSMDGLVQFLSQIMGNHQGGAIEEEINRRRFFYLYIAVLLTVAHDRAKLNSKLWDALADIWVLLMPGARSLHVTLKQKPLWAQNEVSYFDDIKTEDDGEKYVEALLLPQEIRYHTKLNEWRERDLPQDLRDELARMDKMFRGEA